MLASTHRRTVGEIKAKHDETISALDNEYIRARDEGRRQVHAWAVEVNSNLFYGTGPFQNMATWQRPRVGAALQDAEHQFRPTRTQLEETKEITDGSVRP
jgi:hypothetical protein